MKIVVIHRCKIILHCCHIWLAQHQNVCRRDSNIFTDTHCWFKYNFSYWRTIFIKHELSLESIYSERSIWLQKPELKACAEKTFKGYLIEIQVSYFDWDLHFVGLLGLFSFPHGLVLLLFELLKRLNIMTIKTREWIRKPLGYNTCLVIEFVLQYLYEFRTVVLCRNYKNWSHLLLSFLF